jgi:hypothetical protein
MIGYYGGDDNSRGNLYYFGERWDVSTGTAVPDSYAALDTVSNILSKIRKMTTQDAIVYLQSEFSKIPTK